MAILPEVVVVGCGKVGGSLAVQFRRIDWPIRGLAGRRADPTRAAAETLGVPRATTAPWEITPGAGIVLITTPDGVIRQVCDAIADRGGFTAGTVVLHCSGAHDAALLESAAAAGAATGSMHPLQSFAAVVRTGNPFAGIVMAVEGAPAAVDAAETVARALGARPLRLRSEGKTLYHAAAVAASNYLVSLLDMALEMLSVAGIDPAEALPVLSPLIDGTLANIGRRGTTEALTGPIVRGDAQTVALHLAALQAALPHLLPAYRSLGRQALRISRKKGHLPAETVASLARLLETGAPD